jgi:hypothetical protein
MKKFKWFFKELVLIYSNKPSFLSKKRIESGISFLIAQIGMVFFLAVKYDSLSMGEFILWASAEFAVAGYIVNQIQKEKVQPDESGSESEEQ